MFIDARTLSANTMIETEVCIIGAGAAGITLAKACMGQSFRVRVLESGDLAYEAETQALYRGYNSGFPIPLDAMRLRYFGGSTNHWGNYCRPLDALDFEARDWVPNSGWPFPKKHLDPYYERAQTLCQLGPYRYEIDDWATTQKPALPFASNRVQTSIFQVRERPTRFGEVYRHELKTAANITTYLHSNVIQMEADRTGRTVSHLRVASLSGSTFWVRAKRFVLATGGIENARLLLHAHRAEPSGFGNHGDHVGRYFMGHALMDVGVIAPSDIYLPTKLYYEKSAEEEVSAIGHLALSAQTQRQERLLNLNVALLPVFVSQRGVMSLRRLFHGRFDDLTGDVKRVIGDLDGVTAAVYRHWVHGAMPVETFRVTSAMEQMPQAESRVTLTSDRDALGVPRAQLNWRLSDIDVRSLRRSLAILGAELGRAGLGRLRVTLGEHPETWTPQDGGHHMGTTRMHPDPKQGVVDANCKVHGMSNLFVAGSSVFPTSGHANPTLTIVALALRLAEHLKKNLT